MAFRNTRCVALVALGLVGCGGRFGAGTGGTGPGGTTGSGGISATGGSAQAGGPAGGSGGAAVDYRACTVNSDCVLRAASCCGACGAPTRADVIALSQGSVSAYGESVCDANQTCPACAAQTDPTLVATCQQGQCAVVDLTLSPLTACSGDATACVLRTNACCECGGSLDQSSIIALNHQMVASFTALVCDPNQGCLACLPVYPSNVQVQCSAGRCVAQWN